MDFYQKLEFNRLIKELDFIDSDLVYKSNVLKKADEDFMTNVNVVLESYPQLKSLLDDKLKKTMNLIHQKEQISENSKIEEQIVETTEILHEVKDPKLKTLYRQIARTTHPDVACNLNEVFLDAQKAYDSNDLVQILSICEKLKINYEITAEEFEIIKGEISLKKQRIQFLESTYTWRWYNEQSIETKIKIILNYLETQLIR
jgi:uncharacterized protein YcbK (DUF882 family)